MRFSKALTVLFIFLLALTVNADFRIFENDSASLDFTGFVKIKAIWLNHDTNGKISSRWPMPDLPEYDNNNFVFTPTETRFGFTASGPVIYGDTKISGVIELDFFDTASRNTMKPRIRHAFINLSNDSYSILIGQHWDLFGGGALESWLINGFYGETGNMGYRRTQLRFTKYAGRHSFAVSLADPTTDEGSESALPHASVRYSCKLPGNSSFGLSALYGQEKYDSGRVDVEGVSADFILNFFKRLVLMGEVNAGSNLKTYASRSGVYDDPVTAEKDEVDVVSGWMELIYRWEKANAYIGYCRENLTDEDQLGPSALVNTYAPFAGFEHKVGKGFSYGSEVTLFNGRYKDTGKSDSLQVVMSAKYKF